MATPAEKIQAPKPGDQPPHPNEQAGNSKPLVDTTSQKEMTSDKNQTKPAQLSPDGTSIVCPPLQIWMPLKPIPLDENDIGNHGLRGQDGIKNPNDQSTWPVSAIRSETNQTNWNKDKLDPATEATLRNANQSVVKLTVTSETNPGYKDGISFGSGFAVGKPEEKYILTDDHVIADSKKIEIEIEITTTGKDGKQHEMTAQAHVVGRDTVHDVALLQLNSNGTGFKFSSPLPLADKGTDLPQDPSAKYYLSGHPFGAKSTIVSPTTIDGKTNDFYANGPAFNFYSSLQAYAHGGTSTLPSFDNPKITGINSSYHGDSGGPVLMVQNGKLVGAVGLMDLGQGKQVGTKHESYVGITPITYGQTLLDRARKQALLRTDK